MPIRQNYLINESYYYTSNYINSRKSSVQKKAFLCHSHKDETLAKGLIVILKNYGINLYIDWLDNELPSKPDKNTAIKIKKKIEESDLFLFLATKNSKESVWCPWELGIADSINKNIKLIPTEDQTRVNYGNEYLELYDRIDVTQSGLRILTPTNNMGITLSEYNILNNNL